MARLTLWYSVGNGGDGSSYPQFFENERLTEMDQELVPEGWSECCNGSIVIEGSDDMRVVRPHVVTEDEFVKKLDDQINSKGNYYNNLSAWKIQKMKDAPEEESKKKKEKKFKNPSKEDNDMPF